jgi:hypothetical protein
MLNIIRSLVSILHRFTLTLVYLSLRRIGSRQLEIGPANKGLEGFDGLNVVWSPGVKIIANAVDNKKGLKDRYDFIIASHVIEHIPWFLVKETIDVWLSYLKVGGKIHIWTVDGLKLSAELSGYFDNYEAGNMECDNWYRLNPEKDRWTWINARIFSYGDGTGNVNHHNWHCSLHSFRSISSLYPDLLVRELSQSERIGKSHGHIEFGIEIIKR